MKLMDDCEKIRLLINIFMTHNLNKSDQSVNLPKFVKDVQNAFKKRGHTFSEKEILLAWKELLEEYYYYKENFSTEDAEQAWNLFRMMDNCFDQKCNTEKFTKYLNFFLINCMTNHKETLAKQGLTQEILESIEQEFKSLGYNDINQKDIYNQWEVLKQSYRESRLLMKQRCKNIKFNEYFDEMRVFYQSHEFSSHKQYLSPLKRKVADEQIDNNKMKKVSDIQIFNSTMRYKLLSCIKNRKNDLGTNKELTPELIDYISEEFKKSGFNLSSDIINNEWNDLYYRYELLKSSDSPYPWKYFNEVNNICHSSESVVVENIERNSVPEIEDSILDKYSRKFNEMPELRDLMLENNLSGRKEKISNVMNKQVVDIQESPKWARLNSLMTNLQSVAIIKDTLRVGRSQDCDFVLTEKNFEFSNIYNIISKHHFNIIRSGHSSAHLKDTSKNGTYINGIRVKKNDLIKLNDRDKISLGEKRPYIFSFQYLVCEELPDTLTPLSTLDNTPKYTEILPVWGRLLSCLLYLDSYDLYKDTFKVGRSENCDISIEKTNLSRNNKNIFSKEHFIIKKDPERNIAYITDLSKAGTYLNQQLIGKNKMHILQHNDNISVGPKLHVFIYKCMYEHDTNFLPLELKSFYEPSTILGKGAVGEVRLAYEKSTCKMVAIKKIMKGRSTASQMHMLNHPSKIQTEISILSALNYPFIISMKNIVETPKEVFIVLDYMQGGELTNRILSLEPMTELNAKFFFYQMVLAVEYLHSRGITHRDLKPENVLLKSDEPETLIKVSDFGLSKVNDEDDMMRTICGTMSYIAPEILNRCIPEYNRQVDVWSLGVILFYMLGKRLPFKSSDRGVLEKMIISGQYSMNDDTWKEVSLYSKDLVKKMLNIDPVDRITIKEILKHPWLSRDTETQLKVNSLYENYLVEDESVVLTYDIEPPLKRIRLSSEESCSFG